MEEFPPIIEACQGLKGTVAGIIIAALSSVALATELITMWPAIVLFALGVFAVIPTRFYAFYSLIKDQIISILRK